ncbi:MAG: hypothetical protein WCA78_00580 [Rhizomicrobium sp.]
MSTRPDFLALDARLMNLLLASAPLLRFVRSERGNLFRAAWIDAATGASAALMKIDEEDLPNSPKAWVTELFHLTLELGEVCGLTRPDFVQIFNDSSQIGKAGKLEYLDEALARGFAILLNAAAQRQAQLAKAREDAERAVA